jgi:hypothetical protein
MNVFTVFFIKTDHRILANIYCSSPSYSLLLICYFTLRPILNIFFFTDVYKYTYTYILFTKCIQYNSMQYIYNEVVLIFLTQLFLIRTPWICYVK